MNKTLYVTTTGYPAAPTGFLVMDIATDEDIFEFDVEMTANVDGDGYTINEFMVKKIAHQTMLDDPTLSNAFWGASSSSFVVASPALKAVSA